MRLHCTLVICRQLAQLLNWSLMCTKHLPDSVLIFGGKIFSSFRSTVSHKVVLFQFDLDREYLWIKVGTSLPYLIRSMKDIPGLKEHYTSNVFEGTSLYFGQYNNIITCPRKAEGFNIPLIDSFKSIYMITFTQCCHFGVPPSSFLKSCKCYF